MKVKTSRRAIWLNMMILARSRMPWNVGVFVMCVSGLCRHRIFHRTKTQSKI